MISLALTMCRAFMSRRTRALGIVNELCGKRQKGVNESVCSKRTTYYGCHRVHERLGAVGKTPASFNPQPHTYHPVDIDESHISSEGNSDGYPERGMYRRQSARIHQPN